MERNDAQTDRGGGGLSTQDLLEAEPRKEQAPKEQAPKGDAPEDEAPEGHVTETKTDEPGPQLFAEQEVGEFREQWQVIQAAFVADPQHAGREADELVAAVIQ